MNKPLETLTPIPRNQKILLDADLATIDGAPAKRQIGFHIKEPVPPFRVRRQTNRACRS